MGPAQKLGWRDQEEGYRCLPGREQQPRPSSWREVAFATTCLSIISGLVGTAVGTKVSSGAVSEVAFTAEEALRTCSIPLSPAFNDEPLAKHVVREFDWYLMTQAAFATPEQKFEAASQWLAPEFEYETIGFPNTHSLKDWIFGGEETQFRRAFNPSVFSQMLFFGDTQHATTTSYGNVRWIQELFGIPPQNAWVYFRVTDFYILRRTDSGNGLLSWNLMMIDWADLFRQVGRPVLPAAPLPEGLVLTAHANDGVPAPLSAMVVGRNSTAAKLAAEAALNEWVNDDRSGKWLHDDLTFYGPGGIGLATSKGIYQSLVIQPFRDAFADRKLEKDMLFCEGNYCAACGRLWGKHVGTWVGQAASQKYLNVRFGMHWRVENDTVREGWAIFDFPGLLKQLGKDFYEIARKHNQTVTPTPA